MEKKCAPMSLEHLSIRALAWAVWHTTQGALCGSCRSIGSRLDNWPMHDTRLTLHSLPSSRDTHSDAADNGTRIAHPGSFRALVAIFVTCHFSYQSVNKCVARLPPYSCPHRMRVLNPLQTALPTFIHDQTSFYIPPSENAHFQLSRRPFCLNAVFASVIADAVTATHHSINLLNILSSPHHGTVRATSLSNGREQVRRQPAVSAEPSPSANVENWDQQPNE